MLQENADSDGKKQNVPEEEENERKSLIERFGGSLRDAIKDIKIISEEGDEITSLLELEIRGMGSHIRQYRDEVEGRATLLVAFPMPVYSLLT